MPRVSWTCPDTPDDTTHIECGPNACGDFEDGKSNSMMEKGIPRAVPIAFSLAGVVLSLVGTSRYGAGISPDSAAYISAARSLLAGQGYVCHDRTPYTGWPPLFPTLLAGIGLTGVDPATGARFLNAFAFGGIILASGAFFARCLRSKALVIVATLSVVLSYPLLDISVMALTEAVFVLLIVLFVLAMSAFLKNGRIASLMLVSALAGLCLLQRYTGVTLVIAGVFLIMVSDRARPSRRLWHAGCLLAISCTPMALWVLRNLLGTHMLTGHVRLNSMFTLQDNVVFAADTATQWFVPGTMALSARLAIVMGLLLLAIIVLLISSRIGGSAEWNCPCLWPAGVVILTYIPLLLYTHQVGVLNEPLNDRYLSPLAVLVLWLLFAGMDRVGTWLSAHVKPGATIVVGLCTLWLLYPLGRVRAALAVYREYGAGGYSWTGWQTSPLINWLRSHPLPGTVCCNVPDAIYTLVGSSAVVSPHRTWDMAKFRQTLEAGSGGYLVWFSALPLVYLYDLDELADMLAIEEVVAFEDGGVYRLLPSADCVFPDSRIFSSCMVSGAWNRSFTGDGPGLQGEITSWILRSDGTMDSTWRLHTAEGTAITWRASGRYTRSDATFESHCEGEATREKDDTNSRCSLDVQGTVSGDTSVGTCRIEFADPQWPGPVSGTWRVDLARPVYRLYAAQRGKHLYTMAKEEVRTLTNRLLDRWAYEGVAFYAYPAGQQPPGAQPAYCLQSERLGSRLFTMNEAERDRLLDVYGDVWSDAGVGFYTFSQDSHPCTAKPVYRFWSGALADHFYTASEAERDKLIRNFSHAWTYEGIAWYAAAGRSKP